MSFRSRPHASQGLRLLALLVLMVGLVAKPVLVAACELNDMRLALASVASAIHDTADAGGDPAGDPAGDACCPGQACGECCTAGNMLPNSMDANTTMPLGGSPAVAACVESEPAALPVAIRPPIAA